MYSSMNETLNVLVLAGSAGVQVNSGKGCKKWFWGVGGQEDCGERETGVKCTVEVSYMPYSCITIELCSYIPDDQRQFTWLFASSCLRSRRQSHLVPSLATPSHAMRAKSCCCRCISRSPSRCGACCSLSSSTSIGSRRASSHRNKW